MANDFNNTLINTQVYPVGTTIAVSSGSIAPKRKKPKFDRMLVEAMKRAEQAENEAGNYTRIIHSSDLISIFGNFNPVYNKRPKPMVQMLLNAVPAAVTGSRQDFFTSGLMYKTPYIVGKSRTRYRITPACFRLLAHWNEKFPSFRAFYSAYYKEKYEQEVLEDYAPFYLGALPARYEDMIKLNRMIEKALEIQKAKMEAAQRRSHHLNAYSPKWIPSFNNNTTAVSPSVVKYYQEENGDVVYVFDDGSRQIVNGDGIYRNSISYLARR